MDIINDLLVIAVVDISSSRGSCRSSNAFTSEAILSLIDQCGRIKPVYGMIFQSRYLPGRGAIPELDGAPHDPTNQYQPDFSVTALS